MKHLIGKEVCVGGECATVLDTFDSIPGGVILDRRIQGLRCWHYSELTLPAEDAHKPLAIVVDLDNTLAILNDRHPYDGHLCETDEFCEVVARVISTFRSDHSVLFLTGRNEDARQATERWLDEIGMEHQGVFMRATDDWRPGAEYKAEVMRDRILRDFDVVLALDDDPEIVKAFRAMGVRTWWVNDYERALPERRHTEGSDATI